MEENKAALLDVPTSVAPPTKLTYEEFLEKTSDGTWAEWVNGEVITMTVSNDHMDLVFFLVALFRHFAETNQLGRVFGEPFQMKTGPELPGRAPDVFFVAQANLSKLKKNYFDGPADLVVEIISPESRVRDRGEKFYEYEQGGVREYWLIDPQRKQAEFYQLGEEGIYHTAFVGSEGIYHSVVLKGLWIKVEWLWQEPLPPLLDVLREWGLV